MHIRSKRCCGLITNIGRAHLEGFGGIEGVKKGKGSYYGPFANAGAIEKTLSQLQKVWMI